MAKRHVISLFDLTSAEIRQIFAISTDLQSGVCERFAPPIVEWTCAGSVV